MPRFLAAKPDAALIRLPWNTPLEAWPTQHLVALPRGISRHVVRFIQVGDEILAAKEILEEVAVHEYRQLTELRRLGVPSVEPVGVVLGRHTNDSDPLDPILLTRHLPFSLPYRALFYSGVKLDTVNRLLDAMVALFARLHLTGFYWGDVSLSNILFRRDAGEFAAYLVDAETGELHPEGLTDGKRLYDIDIARTNIIGELMDLQAGALLEPSVDTIEVGDRIVSRYTELWDVLTAEESFSMDERWRLRRRVQKLNEMGYDVAELTMDTDSQGNHITIQPKVVDAGHYHRQVMRLTGLDVQERQGQRMLNDLEAYRAMSGRSDDPIELVAHAWLAEVFEPTIHYVPVEMRRKLEPAEIFHEILEHRWYMSEAQDRYVTTQEAVDDYVATVLPQHRDERAYLGVGDTQEMEAIVVGDDIDEPVPDDDAEFAARDEQTLADYAANPYGFTAGMKFKGE